MTPEQALRDAPCLLRHMQDRSSGRGRRHAALASWGQHVPCMVAALEAAGFLAPPLDNPERIG